MIDVVWNTVFSPVLGFSPVLSLFFIATIFTSVVVALSKVVVNRNLIRETKNKMEEIRERLTAAQKNGNTNDVNNLLNEMMKINSDYMRHNFKGMAASLVLAIMFLPWLKGKFSGAAVAALPVAVPFVGSALGWLGWYVIVSVAVSLVLGKLME